MVIAERSKIVSLLALILGILGTITAIASNNSVHLVFLVLLWVISITLLLIASLGLLSPINAIETKDDCLIINYISCKKVIPLDKIENVTMTERGEYSGRKNSLASDIIFFSDMRRLCINYKENGIFCHSYVVVKNASAAKYTIDSLIKKIIDKK